MASNEGLLGHIVSFDVNDGLGWIALDDGTRVRVGGNAMKGRWPEQLVGVRVRVDGTVPGFGGTTKAVSVTPIDAPGAPPVPPQPPPLPHVSWPAIARIARFSDADAISVPHARPIAPITLAPHPLFDPWRAEIGRGATRVPLVVPTWRARDPIDPGATDSFALGRIAFLETPAWPRCGLCSKALMMCTQLAPDALADFGGNGRGLVAMFCFRCGMRVHDDPRVGFVRWVKPLHRVVGDDVFQDENERALQAATQRVTTRPAHLVLPDANWLRHRAEVVTGTASSVLFGAPFELDDAPDEADEDMLEEIDVAFDDWLEPQHPPGRTQGGWIGGHPNWDQCDETPSCAHGERLFLLDYAGDQFLDGALHVFACREGLCDLAFVAEF